MLLQPPRPAHLLGGIEGHGHIEKLPVEERHPRLDAPGRHRLVGAQDVVQVELVELPHGLGMELAGARRLVEVEIAGKDLVGPLPGEDYLDAHGLDPTGQEEHRGRCADGRDVVGLEVIDDVIERVDPLLDGEEELVVHGTDRLGRQPGGGEVRRTLEADGEGVESGPPGLARAPVLHPSATVACREGADQGGVETAGEQHAVRDVGHELPLDRPLQRLAQADRVLALSRHRLELAPRRMPVAHGSADLAVQDVARRELLDVAAGLHQGLHFGGHEQVSLLVVAHVERHDADRVPGDYVPVPSLVVEGEGEDPVQVVEEVEVTALVERQDDLAVRARLEGVGRVES